MTRPSERGQAPLTSGPPQSDPCNRRATETDGQSRGKRAASFIRGERFSSNDRIRELLWASKTTPELNGNGETLNPSNGKGRDKLGPWTYFCARSAG